MSHDPSLLPEDMRAEDGGAAATPPPGDPSAPAPSPTVTGAGSSRRNGRNGKRGKAFRGITLIPSDLREAEIATAWVPGIAIAGILLALLLIGVPWVAIEGRIAETRRAVDALEARRERAREGAAIAERDLASYRRTVARAVALRELRQQHRDWSPFLALLEGRTLPNVRYEGLTADVAGNVMLPVSAPSIRAAAEQIKAWQEATDVSKVEISGIASSADALGVIRGARFNAQFQVDPKVFTASSAATSDQ